MGRLEENAEADLPLEANFVEQAEYIEEAAFTTLSAELPDEDSIVRRLSVGGAKLLVGPRGCGKTTLMLKAFYQLLRDVDSNTLPVYVNFKISLKLEPLYVNTPNATFWFRLWLNLKIYEGLYEAIALSHRYRLPEGLPPKTEITAMLSAIEAGHVDAAKAGDLYNMASLSQSVSLILSENNLIRCVLLLDDAAHAFSPRQQEDFFEFFRQIKSREISPKAAIYPGITTHSPTFHVGHDAEQIDVWARPDSSAYLNFMRSLAVKRFNGDLPKSLKVAPEALDFLAYASFGIPRSFLNMLRTIYHEEAEPGFKGNIDRRKLLEVAKQSRELSHSVYDSLIYKLPAYKHFVETGHGIYQNILSTLKEYNRSRDENNQAREIGVKRPITPEMEKVFGFLQYAGLMMPTGANSRGVKGVFDLYLVHFGDLVTENAMIGRRTKSVPAFVKAFAAQTHQAWPRISPDTLVASNESSTPFSLILPHCQACGAERASENARFCQNCGAQLKTASLYDDLTKQDISVLALSGKIISRIKQHSKIRTIKDILMDSDRQKLRSIPFIGPIRAARISNYAEEFVA
ncbi:zinc ribbon domain-containing protein [Acidocella sp.]|uniref:zinc ribbon domain-containing protein n=1 Tax=Acidocella sp. TaxID=50710 RepID=UPI00183A4B26|nr:hypothetical protein [Acidocella sp.]NNM56493.1 hypothetical protein [Acidocella sp.]